MTYEESTKGVNTSLAKPLALTAGILGLLQGIAWTVFSVLCICCYCDAITIDQTNAFYSNNTQYYKLIYVIFLEESSGNVPSDLLIKPRDFLIFMCFYLVFCTIWTLISGTTVWAMIHNQRNLAKGLFGSWSTMTILISIVDVVFTSLLIGDYITVNSNDAELTNILVTYGIVMSLAARGYVLWLVNVVFAGILMKYTISIVMKENKDPTVPIINGFDSNNVNPPWFNGSVKDFWATTPTVTNSPYTNNAYENHGFERSQSFFPITPDNVYVEPPTRNNNPYLNNNRQIPNYKQNTPTPANNQQSFSEAIRTATIGRNKGKRSPVNNILPPVIPDPDYTPPNSPNGLKSVLRSKSNYSQPLQY